MTRKARNTVDYFPHFESIMRGYTGVFALKITVMEEKEMKHISEIIKACPATPRLEPSAIFHNDQVHSERLTTICFDCGKEIAYIISYSPDGTRHGLKPARCIQCSQTGRDALRLQELERDLPQECQKQRNRWLQDLEVPGIFKIKAAAGFEKFEKALQPAAFEAVRGFNGRSIVLFSPEIYGIGKTHLVCALAFHLVKNTEAVTIDKRQVCYHRHFSPVQFITESALLLRIRATYNRKDDGENEEDVYNSLSKYELLIMDDVGKVRPRDYSFLQGVYFRIIDHRYTHRQSVIITTNLSLVDLENHIGGACADRLREMCGLDNFVKMTGRSCRGGLAK
jgi:DNA replication protein DnaC